MLRRMQQQLQQGSLWTSSMHSQPQTSFRRAWWPSTGSEDNNAMLWGQCPCPTGCMDLLMVNTAGDLGVMRLAA